MICKDGCSKEQDTIIISRKLLVQCKKGGLYIKIIWIPSHTAIQVMTRLMNQQKKTNNYNKFKEKISLDDVERSMEKYCCNQWQKLILRQKSHTQHLGTNVINITGREIVTFSRIRTHHCRSPQHLGTTNWYLGQQQMSMRKGGQPAYVTRMQ